MSSQQNQSSADVGLSELSGLVLVRWISCRDTLPEKDGYYLVLTLGCVVPHERVPIVMRYLADIKRWYSHQLTVGYDGVTHWMPIPPPPNKELCGGA